MERRDVDIDYYEARAQDVKLEDITSSAHNADILRRLRDNLAMIEGEGIKKPKEEAVVKRLV